MTKIMAKTMVLQKLVITSGPNFRPKTTRRAMKLRSLMTDATQIPQKYWFLFRLKVYNIAVQSSSGVRWNVMLRLIYTVPASFRQDFSKKSLNGTNSEKKKPRESLFTF